MWKRNLLFLGLVGGGLLTLGANLMPFSVEVDEIAGPHVDCANTEAHAAGIDPIEIDQTLQRLFQEFSFVKARGFD